MFDPASPVVAATALPLVYPLDALYARAGLPLPQIEKVSGQPYRDFMIQRVFKPLEMTCTYVGDVSKRPHAQGYVWSDLAFRPTPGLDPAFPYAAGAIVTNLCDMIKWQSAFTSEKLLTRASLDQIETAFTLNDGSQSHYGFGWEIRDRAGHKTLSHGGSVAVSGNLGPQGW